MVKLEAREEGGLEQRVGVARKGNIGEKQDQTDR